MMGLCVAMVIVTFGNDAGKCADKLDVSLHMCSGFPTEKVEQMIMTLFDDITRISHANVVGTIYEKQAQASGLLSGFLELNSWVNC